jgi:hypothetical protein
MKNLKVYTLAALLLAAIPCLKAQDSEVKNDEIVTLVGNSNHIGGYGAFSVRYFDLDKRDGIMLGGRGGIIVGHGISFGLTGTGFLTQSIYDPLLGEDAMLAGGYGGIYIEPILFPRSPVHLSFPITFGGGGIGYNTTHYDDDNRYDWDDDYIGGAGFLLVEPGVEVEFNVMKYFRLALGASYKFTSDFNLRYDNIGDNRRVIANNALNGFTGGITFKFGVF